MKMTVDGLLHNVLTEVVFLKNLPSSVNISILPLQLGQSNVGFSVWRLHVVIHCWVLNDSPATTSLNRLSSQKYKTSTVVLSTQSGSVRLVESSCFLSVSNKYSSFRSSYKRVRSFPRDNHLTCEWSRRLLCSVPILSLRTVNSLLVWRGLDLIQWTTFTAESRTRLIVGPVFCLQDFLHKQCNV